MFSKKHGQFPGCIVHEKSELSIWYRLFFGVFSYVFRISHRFLLCFHNISGQHGTDPQRFVHATLDFYLYWTSLQRWGGGEGGYGGGGMMMSMRMRLTSTVSFAALCIGGEGGMGGC